MPKLRRIRCLCGAFHGPTVEDAFVTPDPYLLFLFGLGAVILLVAIVAAISLTMRRREGTRYQDPAAQVRVRKADRLRMVKMDVEKKPE